MFVAGLTLMVPLMAILPTPTESFAGLDLDLRHAAIEGGVVSAEVDVRNPFAVSHEGVLLRLYCTFHGGESANLHVIATSAAGRGEAEGVRERVPVAQEIDLPGGIPAGGKLRLTVRAKAPVEGRSGTCSRVELRGLW